MKYLNFILKFNIKTLSLYKAIRQNNKYCIKQKFRNLEIKKYDYVLITYLIIQI